MDRIELLNGATKLVVTATGTGDDVLFLHGLSSSSRTWKPIVDTLAGMYQCWTLDFRGHGESDRAPGTYRIVDYASDAVTVLDHIGRPTVLVGHSLGGITAAHVAADGHSSVRAAYLEDPPLFLGDPEAWQSTIFPTIFPLMHETVSKFQADEEAIEAYVETLATAPSLAGGTIGDHMIPLQLRSHAEALRAMDPEAWTTAIDGSLFHALDPDRPITCPLRVLQADPELGPAFLPGDGDRLTRSSPDATVRLFSGVGHGIHTTKEFDRVFLDDLEGFLSTLPGS